MIKGGNFARGLPIKIMYAVVIHDAVYVLSHRMLSLLAAFLIRMESVPFLDNVSISANVFSGFLLLFVF